MPYDGALPNEKAREIYLLFISFCKLKQKFDFFKGFKQKGENIPFPIYLSTFCLDPLE